MNISTNIPHDDALCASTQTLNAITVTEAAALKIGALIAEEEDWSLKLRVYICGGGCSGFQYGFTFDNNTQDGDTCVKKSVPDPNDPKQQQTVAVLIDDMSIQYLIGAIIDYQEDIHGAQFIIRNPNAKTTCGCGSSFSIE